MKAEKRSRSLNPLGIFIAISVVCAVFTLRYFKTAFPSAEITLSTDGNQATEIARSFLTESLRIDIQGFDATVRFESDSNVDKYLQRVLGIGKLNELMKSNKICIHYWYVKFYNPQLNEKIIVGVTPSGGVDGFHRFYPEGHQGHVIEADSTQAMAERFLIDTLHIDLKRYTLSATTTKEEESGKNYSFTWRKSREDFPDVTEEVHVFLRGADIVYFERYVVVPQSFQEMYNRESSVGNLIARAGRLLSFLLLVLAVGEVIRLTVKRAKIEWRFAVMAALAATAMAMLINVNKLPTEIATFSVTTSRLVSISSFLLYAAITAGIVGLQILIYAAAARTIEGGVFSRSQSAVRIAGAPAGAETRRDIYKPLVMGYGLAAILLAYHTIYYIVAVRFGAWVPARPRISNDSLTYFPAFAILGSAAVSVLSEEIPYRLFGVAAIKKYAKRTWIAISAPALIWAALHAGFVVHPVYLRIIELAIVGIVYGIFFIRYGFVTCAVAHFLINGISGPILLMQSGQLTYIITIASALFLPLIVSYAIWRFSPRTR